ncbi:hypothetical protein DY000_02028979 [Brassica cretica]|uniref:Uncharacterized protein n=1 Tax=Brassica cretica TaxID=69181 RepID=A0ABQ7DZ19_BRACR|nr:hypothetical protein DY000_02028979 [Brassica cretica]
MRTRPLQRGSRGDPLEEEYLQVQALEKEHLQREGKYSQPNHLVAVESLIPRNLEVGLWIRKEKGRVFLQDL